MPVGFQHNHLILDPQLQDCAENVMVVGNILESIGGAAVDGLKHSLAPCMQLAVYL